MAKRLVDQDKNFNRFDEQAVRIGKKADALYSQIRNTLINSASTPLTGSKVAQSLVGKKIKVIENMLENYIDQAYMKSKSRLSADEIKLTKREKEVLIQKKLQILAEVEGISDRLKRQIETTMYTNLGKGMTQEEIDTKIAALYPAFTSTIQTTALTSLQRFYKDTNFTSELKFNDYFFYSGPDDQVTRPYCHSHVNKVYTGEQAEQIQAELLTFYNCRHQLVPITEEQYLQGTKGKV